MSMNGDAWITWQLCDSAFPAGALAHSGGLEAAWQHGEVPDVHALEQWISAMLRQAGRATVPFVAAGWAGAPPLDEVDAACDAFLLNHVANAASRAQGQATLLACARTFDSGAVREVVDTVRRGELCGHHAPAFGAIAKALGLPRKETCELFVFLALRGAVSSAVRLGITGPLQGQHLQHRLSPLAARVVAEGIDVPPDEAAQTAPLCDLLQGLQGRLYSRLFVS